MEVCFKCQEVIKTSDKFITTKWSEMPGNKYHLECYKKIKKKYQISSLIVCGLILVVLIIVLPILLV